MNIEQRGSAGVLSLSFAALAITASACSAAT